MGEYFGNRKEAEEAIRRWGKDVVLFVRILDGSTERWMVDFKPRVFPPSIKILEDLSPQIPSIIGPEQR